MGERNEMDQNKRESEYSQTKTWLQKYILNNLWIKVLSCVVAIVVWMAIVNIEDPYKTKTFTVSVETINEDALLSVNKVYEVIEGSTAQVKVKGKKSVVDKLEAADIKATADLSNLSAVNAVSIVPELTKSVSSEPILECNQVLKVSLEDMETKQVKVSVVTSGTPQSGYSVGDTTARPNMVEVSGGESAINKIDSVRVTVNVNGASEDFTRKLEPRAYDENGDEVVSSTLSYGVKRIRATVHILQTKSIPVNINITGEPAEGYEFVEAECLPEKIEIAGSAKNLSAIDSVEIPIDISGMKSATGFIEQNISIQDYLPEGITVLSEYAQVSLRIGIEKFMQKTISVPVENVKFSSLPEDYTAQIIGETETVDVVIQGLSSVLDAYDEENYTAYVECDGLTPGRYRLSVKVDLGESSSIIRSDKVTVKISKGTVGETTPEPSSSYIPEETETPEPEESE